MEVVDVTDRTCSLPECDAPHNARGLCLRHYTQAQRQGWLPPIIPTPDFMPDEFGCWVWQKSISDKGYGHKVIKVAGEEVAVLAHRWIYEMTYGPIPDGYQIDHLCRNTRCVNPDHMDPVTPHVNQMRGHSPCGINGRKTRCDQGHEYTVENTYLRPDRTGRMCRVCIHERSVKYAAQRKARRAATKKQ